MPSVADFLAQLKASQPKTNPLFGAGTPGALYGAATARSTITPEAVTPTTPGSNGEGGGFLDALNPFSSDSDWGNRLMDIASRPQYAMMNIVEEMGRRGNDVINEHDGVDLGDMAHVWGGVSLGQAWQGLSGQQKLEGSKAFQQIPGFSGLPKPAQAAIGLVGDIGLDPTTYVGVGLVKDVASGVFKGAKAVEEASEVTDAVKSIEAAQEGATTAERAALPAGTEAVARRIKANEEGVYNVTSMPERTPSGAIPMGAAGTTTETVARTPEGAIPLANKILPEHNTDALDELSNLAKGPEPKIEPHKPEIPDRPVEVEPVKPVEVKGATKAVDKIVSTAKGVIDFAKMPVPLGRDIAAANAPAGQWVQPFSTTMYNIPGNRALAIANETAVTARNFVDAAKAAKFNPARLKKAYQSGEIRPPVDTPAERAFMGAYSALEMPNPKKDFIEQIDFHSVKPELQQELIHGSPEIPGEVMVLGGAKGNTIQKFFTPKDLWDMLHGTKVEGKDPTKLFVRTSDGKVSIAQVAEANKKALSDPKYWQHVAQKAERFAMHPEEYARDLMQRNVNHLLRSKNQIFDDFEDYKTLVKQDFPGVVADETLKICYESAKHAVDKAWKHAVENNPQMDVDKFLTAQELNDDLRVIMARAVAKKAPPEELASDIAHAEYAYDAKELSASVKQIVESGATPEAKAAAQKGAEETLQHSKEKMIEANQAAIEQPLRRMEEAQAATSNVATKVRDTKNLEGLGENAKGTLDGTEFGSSMSRETAEGIVKGVVSRVTKVSKQANSRSVVGRNFPAYHHMNQSGTLNEILGKMGLRGASAKAVAIRKGFMKYKDRIVISGRAANIMEAAEHQMDEVAGMGPTAWAMTTKGKGYKLGEPGVIQDSRHVVPLTKEEHNVPFSSAKLMKDMIAEDYEAVAKGGKNSDLLPTALFGQAGEAAGKKSSFWTHVVQAAAFKDAGSLASIKKISKPLHDYLLKYDPAPNVAEATERYQNKVRAFTDAQTEAAERAVSDAKLFDSPARAAKVQADVDKTAAEAVERTPAAPIADKDAIAKHAQEAADDLADAGPPKTPTETAQDIHKNNLAAASHKSELVHVTNKASREVQKASGATKAVPGQTVSDPSFNSTILNRLDGWFKYLEDKTLGFRQKFQTHAGMKTLRPLMQNAFGRVADLMGKSARDWQGWSNALKALPEGEGLRALHALNPHSGIALDSFDEETQAIIRAMRQRIESIYGGTGTEKYMNGNTLAVNAGLTMEQINGWLRAKRIFKPGTKEIMQFTREDMDFGGKLIEYSKDNAWLKQWETMISGSNNVDEAIHALHGMESAMHSAVIERALFDDVAVRFGVKGAGHMIGHQYLTGVEFPEDIAKEVQRMIHQIDELHKPIPADKRLAQYDQLLRMWKTGMTIYTPSHHVRNAAGDLWLLGADIGMRRSAIYMKKSLGLINMYRPEAEAGLKRSSWRSDPKTLLDPAKLEEEMLRAPDAANPIFKNKHSGVELDGRQIMASFEGQGLAPTAGTLEDIVDEGAGKLFGRRMPRPFKNRVHEGASRVGEARDHRIRLAHYLAALEDTKLKRIAGESDAMYKKRLYEAAAQRTRKWHPDGQDLTHFEKTVLRRVIPFYSWQRKSMPLILEATARRPGYSMAYPKALNEMTYATTGQHTQDNGGFGSLPGDQLFPDWMTQTPMGVVGGAALNGMGMGGEGYKLAKGPSTPFVDFIPQLNDPLGQTLEQVTPFARVPAEMASGSRWGTHIPIEGTGEQAQYAAQNVPGLSQAIRPLTNTSGASTDFMNWLLGYGGYDTGPESVKSGQIDLKERLAKARKNG